MINYLNFIVQIFAGDRLIYLRDRGRQWNISVQ